MKINVEIVTGFLGAGKTTFINSLLQESQVEGERVVVFQLEHGIIQLSESKDKNYPVKSFKLKSIEEFEKSIINEIKKDKPNRIIIEYNGTFPMDEFINLLKEKKYKEHIKVSTMFFVADGANFNEYLNNMGNFLVPFMKYADMIVINNIDSCKDKSLKEELKKVKSINPKAFILKVNNKYILNTKLKEAKVLDNGFLKKLKIKLMNSKKI